MSQVDAIEATIAPTLDRLGFDVVDVELSGSGKARTLRVSVDRDGGVDLDAITLATQAVSPLLEDVDVVAGPYTLEVSSPGLERPLRRPEHFARAAGTAISLKRRDATGAVTRDHVRLLDADAREITVEQDGATETVDYDAIVAARTIFTWGSGQRSGRMNSEQP